MDPSNAETGDERLTVTHREAAKGMAVFTAQMCVCKECPGWADKGAPQIACDLPCETCVDPPYPIQRHRGIRLAEVEGGLQ